MKTGIELIEEERKRQVSVEGWTFAHDDEHVDGQLARAAACYALPPGRQESAFERYWPWGSAWWKPSPDNRIRDLTKAGALIAAEIDRLKRIEQQKGQG